MKEKYNVKYVIDCSNETINQEVFNKKENGTLEKFSYIYELPKNKKPKVDEIVQITFEDAILYGKIMLILKMHSGCYEVQVQFIDVIKNKE